MSEQDNKGGGHITAGMGDREQVEKTADRLRDELLLTLEELDRRRERAMDVKYQVRKAVEKNRDVLVQAGGVVLGLAVVGMGYSWWRARHREEILWKHRAQAVRRAWEHPDRVASRAEERPVGIELGRKLVLIFVSTLASAMARRAVQSLVPPSEQQQAPEGKKRLGLRFMQSPAHA
ncbi:hypothetical protein ATI61_107486 [Archangium gephyra]|uniref:Uncharacterized protein n=1 Tax=Archangium gephyra TaxID=48 RepID=A0AAC8QIL6_9BACT|nr:hypothetical protein [Archangium gephyra]AKJ08049.1 Hypothetical protein AA314_09675 [Archangium gephyra]REG29790.1 hypothetical protein ATI61_107486 [Archangium gephyra]